MNFTPEATLLEVHLAGNTSKPVQMLLLLTAQ